MERKVSRHPDAICDFSDTGGRQELGAEVHESTEELSVSESVDLPQSECECLI